MIDAEQAQAQVTTSSSSLQSAPSKTVQEYTRRCVKAYREACSVASKSLEIYDRKYRFACIHSLIRNSISAFRLACLYMLCKALTELDEDPVEAKLIALSTYEIGTNHTHPLNEIAVDILQRIRDDFLMAHAATVEEQEVESEVLANLNVPRTGPSNTRQKTKKIMSFSTYAADNSSKASQYVTAVHNKSKEDGVISTAALASSIPASISREMSELIITIKRGIFTPEPIPLEDISSASDIFQAADHVFRVYIRGNALAGLQTTGSEVALDNRQIALNRFLLEGPFMSWRGFVSVLTDFKVVSVHDVIQTNTTGVDGGNAPLLPCY
jgi:hypothetical protein